MRVQGAPYVMEVTDGSSRGIPIDEKRYEGYCIDLIEQISKELGFKYKYELVPDNMYGNYNAKKKSWNGLIRRLLDRVCKIIEFYKNPFPKNPMQMQNMCESRTSSFILILLITSCRKRISQFAI